MGTKTSIEWTRGDDGSSGASWNPIRARNRETGKVGWFCIHESEGCRHCYSEAINRRLGTGIDFKAQHRDKVEIYLDEKILYQPLRWRRPRKIFANSMTDWMADFVPDTWISEILRVVEFCPQHVFQTLTKRVARQREYFDGLSIPFENLWLGVSVEDQARADERIPLLLDTPAAVRWISAEPLLEKVLFDKAWLPRIGHRLNPPPLQWVVIGGESGPGARPFEIGWARSIIAQCKAAGVPVFMKQVGAVPVIEDAPPFGGDWPEGTHFGNRTGIRELNGRVALLDDRKGGDPEEWAPDLCVREYPAQERA